MALPSHLSPGALDFLSHIMVPDPDLRYGLKQLKQHRWFNIYSQQSERGLICGIPKDGLKIGFDELPISDQVLSEMESKDSIPAVYTRQCLLANKLNSVTAHYYLQLKKFNFSNELDTKEIKFASTKVRDAKSQAVPRSNQNNLKKIAEGLQELEKAHELQEKERKQKDLKFAG